MTDIEKIKEVIETLNYTSNNNLLHGWEHKAIEEATEYLKDYIRMRENAEVR